MNKRQYIINLDMMLGMYYGLTGYYGLKLENLEALSDKKLDILKEKLEILLEEEERVYELYELDSYYFY